jgi:hypothetical protein
LFPGFGASHSPQQSAGSVVNGFESIQDKLMFNIGESFYYGQIFSQSICKSMGRYEANVATKYSVCEHMSTALLLHGNIASSSRFPNNDGFMDMPIGNQIIALNRWKLKITMLTCPFGIKGTFVESLAGK